MREERRILQNAVNCSIGENTKAREIGKERREPTGTIEPFKSHDPPKQVKGSPPIFPQSRILG